MSNEIKAPKTRKAVGYVLILMLAVTVIVATTVFISLVQALLK